MNYKFYTKKIDNENENDNDNDNENKKRFFLIIYINELLQFNR